MRRAKRSYSHRIGLIPGSIIQQKGDHLPSPELNLIRYDNLSAVKRSLTGSSDLPELIADQKNLWLDVSGVHDATLMTQLVETFGIHPIAAEDIQHTIQRPKAEEYGKQLFFVLRMLSWNSEENTVESEQVSLIAGEGYVISFQEHPGDVFDPVRRRILEGLGRVRSLGADYLAYSLADAVVDNYFLVLEALQEAFDLLEERVLFGDGPDPAERVHNINRELLALRRAVWPMREAASALMRGQILSITGEVQVYFRDIYDHIVQIIDGIELMHDSLKGLVDSYHTKVGNATNDVMRVLTIVATIFIPLTFIAGIYGMNFALMPELGWPLGYPLVLVLMAAVAGGMLIYFKRKKWL